MQDLSYFEETSKVLVSDATYDEEGVETSPAVYEDVTQTKAKPETKSLADVERVSARHLGKRPDIVDKFITMYLEGLQWDWLTNYQEYLVALDLVIVWNDQNAGKLISTKEVYVGMTEPTLEEYQAGIVSEAIYETVEEYYSAKALPKEPFRPPVLTVEEWKAADTNYAKLSREASMLAGVEFEGVMCSATAEDMWGLGSVVDWIRAGSTTNFKFGNGNILVLSPDNIDDFQVTWIPFRASFF